MRLSSLLSALPEELPKPAPDSDPVIRGICYDSRAVAAGDLFELQDVRTSEPSVAESMKAELLERIDFYRERGRALGLYEADRPMDPEMIEKLRSLGYLD